MDISIIEKLKEFETSQETILEKKKKEVLNASANQKKEILEKNEMKLQEITSGRQDMIKEAKKEAKKEALETINSFNKKTKHLEKASKNKVEKAVNIIFDEFLNQNV